MNARNPRGQTPLIVLTASRGIQAQMEQVQALMKTMGDEAPAIFERMSQTKLPIEGWDACEGILKAHGAQ